MAIVIRDIYPILILIHVLRMEDDSLLGVNVHVSGSFQSTSSAWRTTAKINKNQLISLYKTYKNILFITTHPELILKIIYKYHIL